MKKYTIILTFLLFLGIFFLPEIAAARVNIPGTEAIEDVSINLHSGGNTVNEVVNTGLYRILPLVKMILMAVLVIFMVYTGAMMIMSMGSDEEQLSASKRQIWYALVALLFINIPGDLYMAFRPESGNTVGNNVEGTFTNTPSGSILFNWTNFGITLNNQIVYFLEMTIFILAVFMLTLAAIWIMTSRGREDKIKEAKNKFIYTILGLIFVGIIEAWKNVAFGGVIKDGINLFESLSNLALFFAAPVAIFFLTLAGYYYITSAGDEERIKKAKSIVINTFFATLILLAAYTFLLDLATIL